MRMDRASVLVQAKQKHVKILTVNASPNQPQPLISCRQMLDHDGLSS